jgi:hypothetical protein
MIARIGVKLIENGGFSGFAHFLIFEYAVLTSVRLGLISRLIWVAKVC